jgi:hypothetical protein
MTTILVTRDYLIADRRTTTGRYGEVTYIDNKCKIEVDCSAIHNGKRIVAMAACGDVAPFTHVKDLIKSEKFVNVELQVIVNVLNEIPVHSLKHSNYEVVCLIEDGECVVISNKIVHTSNGSHNSTYLLRMKSLSDGLSSIVFGSGEGIFSILKGRVDTAKLSFIDVFYFAAGTDQSSSNSYSAYSRTTNELFTVVNPTKQDITERMNRVLKKINFTNMEYKKKNSVNL